MEDSNWLQKEKWDRTSQSGEDGVLSAIFCRIARSNRWAVECGAQDGVRNSNTWRLLNESDWRAVLIEGNRAYYRLVRRRYHANPRVHAVSAMVGATCHDGMDEILQGTPCPLEPDLMVIDIDGCDWWVWRHMHLYRPRVLMVEFNPTIPFWVEQVQPVDGPIFGCSLGALVELGKSKRYELVCVTAYNAVFVQEELFPLLGIEDNSLWTLARHTVNSLTYVFQSFRDEIGMGGYDFRRWGGRHRLIRDFRRRIPNFIS